MRKTLEYTVTDEGRDQGRVYLLTEMPASQAEKWAARAFLAMARSGVEIPDNVAEYGLAGLAMVGLKALGGVSFELAEPLLDEMMRCVQRIEDPTRRHMTRPLVENDIEEISTRLQLRKAVFGLHVDFSEAGGALSSAASPAPAGSGQ